MLDYRARKLYQLVMFPFGVIGRLLFFTYLVASIVIAQMTEYSVAIKIVIAYALFELGGAIIMWTWQLVVLWPMKKLFFWLVDVIPSRGEDEYEARAIVEYGRIIWLGKKFDRSIETWTEKDSDDFASALNWRARSFFRARERLGWRVDLLKEHYELTGEQPSQLSKDQLKKITGHLNERWFETAVINPHYFNSIVGLCVIMVSGAFAPLRRWLDMCGGGQAARCR
jgi:hypothetical protein